LSAWVDVLRTVSRRVERSVLRFNKDQELNPEILAYLNRLSSLFFAIARMESKLSGDKEKHPTYK
jgi:cob(I)alamin adenosyltransferase